MGECDQGRVEREQAGRYEARPAVEPARARGVIRDKGEIRSGDQRIQDATFALPQVYAETAHTGLLDPDVPEEPFTGPSEVRELLGDGIKGLRVGFVGRRRPIQELIPALGAGLLFYCFWLPFLVLFATFIM